MGWEGEWPYSVWRYRQVPPFEIIYRANAFCAIIETKRLFIWCCRDIARIEAKNNRRRLCILCMHIQCAYFMGFDLSLVEITRLHSPSRRRIWWRGELCIFLIGKFVCNRRANSVWCLCDSMMITNDVEYKGARRKRTHGMCDKAKTAYVRPKVCADTSVSFNRIDWSLRPGLYRKQQGVLHDQLD